MMPGTVNNPEVDSTEREEEDLDGLMTELTSLDRREAANGTNEASDSRLGGRGELNMDLRQNFSQVIAEAVQEIKTRYNSGACSD